MLVSGGRYFGSELSQQQFDGLPWSWTRPCTAWSPEDQSYWPAPVFSPLMPSSASWVFSKTSTSTGTDIHILHRTDIGWWYSREGTEQPEVVKIKSGHKASFAEEETIHLWMLVLQEALTWVQYIDFPVKMFHEKHKIVVVISKRHEVPWLY